jgi:phage terminase small subunit
MPISKETLNSKLFKVLSKYDPTPLDATGKVTPMEDEADVFKFTFTKDGEEYGDVFATVDDDRQIVLYYKDDVTQSPDSPTDGVGYNDSWWGFLEQLATWWPREGFSGRVLKDMSKLGSDMAKRKHMKNKDQLGEGYYPMGRKASYSDAIPTVKIVIEHSRVIEEGEQRYRNINRIFLENQEGERYLLDTKKPGIARVYARHIAEGGKVNDDRWNHVHSLCEEYSKMAGFVRATRNGQFNESAQSLVNEGIAHYQSLRESLSRMTGKRGYNAYFESWTPALMETEGDESNLNELFVQETLDPRIESVMPILNRIHKKVSESAVDKQLSKLEEWADSLVEGPAVDANAKSPLGSQSPAIAHFADQLDKNAEMREEESLTSNNPVGIPEGEGNQEIGQMMADDGITYSAEKENEIISKMVEYMKKAGMDSKQIRYLLNYDEDYIADQLSYLPKEGMDENFINMDAQAVTTEEDEMDEGTHTQQDRDLNPNDYERSNTDWSRDPIEAGSDRIHQKISSILKRLEKPKSPQHDKRDTDIGSVLEAALPWEDEDEEDKDDKKPKDTKGSDGSEHGGHSRAKHLAKQAIPKEKEEVNEMDKSQPSAYTGRDTGPRSGPDKEAKPISKEKMTKDATDFLNKSMSKEHKKEVKEGQDDLDRILQIMNHRR